jgi:hypothetical protein
MAEKFFLGCANLTLTASDVGERYDLNRLTEGKR